MATGQYRDKTDLLHPLTTLHWERCRTLRDRVCPTHCTVLQGKVAILSEVEGSGDVLYISSADLLSWTPIVLTFQCTSLTTYQSKFVIVGGMHPSTCERTNILFNSDTGQKWQSKLPPMPTKRSHTSSVSTMSPEVLMVAGGKGPDGMELDKVEVLFGRHWTTVAPLPKACSRMHSTLHDDNLYFIGGFSQFGTVFTCSCLSLLSCIKSANSKTKIRPLWSIFKAPSIYNVVVSYSSYLVSISGKCILRAYSNVSQSWEEATNTGERSDEYCSSVAAAALPTGELIFINDIDGVYRVKQLEFSFDEDQWFMPNVLSRLEAVMGIQIISILAKMHSQLTTTSGVHLQDLWDVPDPKNAPGQYVVEVISQWSGGHSLRPPTWRNLLEALRDIGVPELSQQIVTFMKGKMRYEDAYHHFVSTKEVLELLFLKFLFVGPPRLGKTTLRRRLMGEITDLLSAGEVEHTHPSTAAVETGHSVIVRSVSSTTAVITQAEWFAVQSLTDEAHMLFHKFIENIEASARSMHASVPEYITCSETVAMTSKESSSATTGRVHLAVMPEPSLLTNFISKMKSFVFGQKHKQYHDVPKGIHDTPEVTYDIPEVAAIFKESYQPEFWKEACFFFKAYLRLEDSGGQPELMDMLPALTVGPGLYLLFFSYELDLKSEFKVFYQSVTGETSLPELSTFSLEEMLLSTLSSISCSNSPIVAKEETSSDMKHILQSSKSVVYFVGTHKDKVSDAHIANFDKQLQKIVRGTDFFEKSLVQFCSEDKLVFSIDNMGGGIDEVNEMRNLLERAMEDHFNKLKIPAVWLLFSLCLRMRNVRTATIEDCFDLSRRFNMTPYETKVALWFLHHHAGVMMYFPNVPGLEDLVIIDIQVVYDSVTHLILRAMRFGKVGQATAEKFRRSGQFSLNDLITATTGVDGDFIPPLKLLALLEYLHIIACISHSQQSVSSAILEDDTVYIMPCVLSSASKDNLERVFGDRCHSHAIAPLMIRYKCGFVPIGVFPAMIASLIANELFDLVERGMKKNHVQFRFGPLHALVTLISHPKFYGVIISELPLVECEPHRLCVEIRNELECTLEKVGSHMNYGSFMDFQFAFECPTHPGREHLCVFQGGGTLPKLMLCLQDLANKVPVVMNEHHKVWFGEPLASPTCQRSVDAQSSFSHEIHLETSQHHVAMFVRAIPDLVEAVKPCIHSVSDHCLSVGLISIRTYETILQRQDLIKSDKARILLNDIRSALSLSHKPELLHQFATVLHNIGGMEDLIHQFESHSQ